jgi:hypothetical protein
LTFPYHKIYTLSWTFDIHPGTVGETAVFNGTIQHAIQQMEEAYPGWTQKYEAHVANKTTLTPQKRDYDDFWRQPINCNTPGFDWMPALFEPIHQGYYYLRGLNGSGGIGNKGCGRVSCSYDSGIWICNDVDSPF